MNVHNALRLYTNSTVAQFHPLDHFRFRQEIVKVYLTNYGAMDSTNQSLKKLDSLANTIMQPHVRLKDTVIFAIKI